jgi:ATP-binding cassette subfamily B protein
VKLYGGERQRIALARAILKNPPILIFDEATSALDSQSERAIQSELDRLARNRSSLVIAHRLSTVVGADQIVVLERGRVVERGRHAELLKKDGAYAQLWQLQLSDEKESAPAGMPVRALGRRASDRHASNGGMLQ